MCENSNWQMPLWLTDSYLDDVLKKYLRDEDVKIINVDIKPATSNGENYASILSRIKIEFIQEKITKQPKELTFILKYSYESDPFVANVMSEYDAYNTELQMYKRILPQLDHILMELGDSEKLFAKTLYVDFEKSAIIFEDLTQHNYVLADRLLGLDENHACLVLKKLAKFHAASAVLNRRLKGELEKFQRGVFNRHTRAFASLYENLIEICAKFAQGCSELGPYYHDKLIKLKPYIVDYCTKAYSTTNPNHFYTLCHGDLWTNNMMMRYESSTKKSLKDVLLIDFQLSNWSSPAVDLFYFFHSSLESKLQLDVHALNRLVQYYHGILVDVLKRLKYNDFIPTLHQFHIQLEEGKILALTAATGDQAIMTNDQCEDADYHALLKDNEKCRNFRNTMYQNTRLQNNLKVLLPYFDQIGLLDIQE